MLAPLRLMHFRSLRGEIDDDDDDEWRGRRKESAAEGGRRDWRGQVSKARGVRSRGKREADLAAWMFLSFFVPLLPPPPEPSNYVVKREAIKTQEIEQQSHLRGCRFATVYWSTTATGGGGGEKGRKERKEPARRSSEAGRERDGRGVEEPDKKSAGRFAGIEVPRAAPRRAGIFPAGAAGSNEIGRARTAARGDAEVGPSSGHWPSKHNLYLALRSNEFQSRYRLRDHLSCGTIENLIANFLRTVAKDYPRPGESMN